MSTGVIRRRVGKGVGSRAIVLSVATLASTLTILLAVPSNAYAAAQTPKAGAVSAPVLESSPELVPPSLPVPPVGDDEVSSVVEEAVLAATSGESVEVVDERTLTSTTFVTPEGVMETEVALAPLNVPGANGDLVPVDSTLRPASEGEGWVNGSGALGVRLPSSLAGGVIEIDVIDGLSPDDSADTVVMSWQGAADVVGVIDGSRVTYPGAFPGVDVSFVVTATSVQKILTLHDADAQASFTTEVSTTGGAVVVDDGAGGLLVQSKGKTVVEVPRPWAIDAFDAYSGFDGAVALTSVQTDAARWDVGLTVDPAWLASADRVFPVTVDPYIQLDLQGTGSVKDCHIISGAGYTTGTYCTSSAMEIGRDGGAGSRRALYRFDLAAVPAGATVAAATGYVYQNYAFPAGAPSSVPVNVHQVTQDWNTGSVSWANRDQATSTAWSTVGGTYAGTPSGSFTGDRRENTTYTIQNLAPLVQSWVNNPPINRGMLLKAANEASDGLTLRLQGSEGTSSPRLLVRWTPRVGAQSYDTILSEQLSDRESVGVNVASGNLLVQATDVQMEGTGQDTTVSRTYNSLNVKYGTHSDAMNAGEFGPGWGSEALGDMQLRPIGDHDRSTEVNFAGEDMLLTGPAGTRMVFNKVGASLGPDGWVGPPASSATLQYNPGAYEWTLTFKKTNLVYRFIEWSNFPSCCSIGAVLKSVTDANNNAVTVTGRTSDYIPTQITDTRGRVLTVAQTPGSPGPTRHSSITDALVS